MILINSCIEKRFWNFRAPHIIKLSVIVLFQAFLFYLPRLFWTKHEESRITSISDGVRVGTVVKCDDSDQKLSNVAKNVANYIKLDQAGHFQYGMFYVLAQVNILLHNFIIFSFFLNFSFSLLLIIRSISLIEWLF